MTDLESTVQEITWLHLDPAGFLVQLRMANFDEAQFELCMQACQRYTELTRGERLIDKRVARFVLDLVDVTRMMAANFHEHGLPIAKKTIQAYIAAQNLADHMLPLPFTDKSDEG